MITIRPVISPRLAMSVLISGGEGACSGEKSQPERVDTPELTLQQAFVARMRSAFCEGVSRGEALLQTQAVLRSEFCDGDDVTGRSGRSASQVRAELYTLSCEFPNFTVRPAGGKMDKADERSCFAEHAKLRHTVIRDDVGRCHEVLTTVYPDEAQDLMGAGFFGEVGKFALGNGAFGVVRLARDDNNEFEAVKKLKHTITDDKPAREIAILKKITQGDHLVGYRASAQIVLTPSVRETFIFMDLAGHVDGNEAIDLRDHHDYASDAERDQYMHHIGKQYIQAVTQLHALGIYHCDLKLENFTHAFGRGGSEHVKLIDYGAATEDEFALVGTGTPGSVPPEATMQQGVATPHKGGQGGDNPSSCASRGVLSNAKRDAWALGIVLLSWRIGEDPSLSAKARLNLVDRKTGERNTLRLAFERGECLGTRDSDRWAGNTWDEVIAKLLDADPSKRMMPAQVLQCPLFANDQERV
jgi:hypothetical protein